MTLIYSNKHELTTDDSWCLRTCSDEEYDSLVNNFFDDVYEDNYDKVENSLKLGVFVDIRNDDNHTPLHIAASNGFFNLVKLLISYGADVNATDNFLMTPLMHSCSSGCIEIAKLLISSGANVFATSFYQIDVISYAAYYGHLDMMKLFQKYNVPLDNIEQNCCMVSPLIASCASESIITIIYLCMFKDVDVNRRIESLLNMSALDFCIITDKMDICDLLIELGSDVNMISFNSGTAKKLRSLLHRRELHSELVYDSISLDKLLPVTPDNRKKDRRQKKVDIRSLIRDENILLINEILIRNIKYEPLPENHNGLMYAAIIGNIKVAEMFIQLGEDINKKEPILCFTPIMIAAACGNDEMVQYLMDKGCYVDVVSVNDITLYDIMVMSRGISKETFLCYDHYINFGMSSSFSNKKEKLWKKIGSYFKGPKKKCHTNFYPGCIALKKRIYDNMERTDIFSEEFFKQFEYDKIPYDNNSKWLTIDIDHILDNSMNKLLEEPIQTNTLILDNIPCETYNKIFSQSSEDTSTFVSSSGSDTKKKLENLDNYYTSKDTSKRITNSKNGEKVFNNTFFNSNEIEYNEIDENLLDILVDAAFTMLDGLIDLISQKLICQTKKKSVQIKLKRQGLYRKSIMTSVDTTTVVDVFQKGEKIVHLDLKGAPPKIIFYHSFFPFLKKLGVTAILIEYEDMFPYHGKLSSIKCENAYTIDEIKEINKLAILNALELIPLVQTFGHLEFVLKHNKFYHLREVPNKDDSICPSDEETYMLLEEMISQIKDLHPLSTRIHIGADEAYHVNKDYRCQENKTDDISIILRHISKLSYIIKKSIGFCEILAWYDMFEKATIKQLRMYDFDKLITPVIWGYHENLSYLTKSLLEKFCMVFKKIYFAGAFKGAMKQDTQFNDPNRYLKNLKSYVKYYKDNKDCFKEDAQFGGVILTGWSRFSHHLRLCELLPPSMFSLVQELVYLNNIEEKADIRLAREAQNLMINGFPGHDLYILIEEMRELHNEIERNGYHVDMGRMNELKNKIRSIFKVYFYDSTWDEWEKYNCPSINNYIGVRYKVKRQLRAIKSLF
uniref:beta-N-acetylhexosaminidase n=1 Tax=Strongyloides stercoralis TaxID=6248 RepID=A0A0K0E2P1_STRER